jgi:hypothetical protein
MSDCQFMRWRAYVHAGVVENQIFDMDEFSRDPHAGGRVEKVSTFDEALPDRAAAHDLIETREMVFRCRFQFAISIVRMSCAV